MFLQRIRHHLGEDGLGMAAYLVVKNGLLLWSQALEKRYDRRHNIRTRKILSVAALAIGSPNKKFSEDYIPTPVSILKRSLTAVRENIDEYIFIDIGSGKGRMLFDASNYPFKKIIGVEFSESLHRLCQKNLAHFRNRRQKCHDLVCLHTDVMDYDFPDEKLFIFMFNPFRAELMEKFIDKLARHHARSGKKIYLAYYNPKHGELLQAAPFLRHASHRSPLLYCSIQPMWPLATFETVEQAPA